MEDSPEVSPTPAIKESKRPAIQERVDQVAARLDEEQVPHANAQSLISNIDVVSVYDQARSTVAHEIMLERSKKREEKMKELATKDSMTGLLNKRGYQQELEKALDIIKREGGELKGLYIDLDGLKLANDLNGNHSAKGDLLITDSATALKTNSRDVDIVARVGGDEFVVVLRNPDEGGVTAWWDRLKPTLKERGLRLSAGAVDIDINDAEESMRRADEAMYFAKQSKADGESHLARVIPMKKGYTFEEYKPETQAA